MSALPAPRPGFAIAATSLAAATFLVSPAVAQTCGDEVVLNYLDAGTSEPVLRTPRGAPVLGGDFAFQVERGAPFVLGVLLYSGFEKPVFDSVFGATVWPEFPWFAKFFGTNADGNSPFLLDTPEIPSDLCGAQATFQGFLFDVSAPSGVTVANAVRLRVGSVNEPLFPVPLEVAGNEAVDLAVGDLDGDGLTDLAAVFASPAHIEVRLADPAGAFFAPSSIPLSGSTPAFIELAHLDADAILDAVVANTDSDDVSVLLGDGIGGFLAETRFPAGNGPAGVAVGDVDGDAFVDLVVAESLEARVTLLSGNGAGSFGAPTSHFAGAGPIGSGIFDVELADVDGDSNLDVIVASFFGNLVGVVAGNGDGTFAAPTTYSTGAPARYLAVGDFDGDLDVDFAAVIPTQDEISIRSNNGDGTYAGAVSLPVGDSPSGIQSAEMDADPADELVVANYGTDDVSVVDFALGGFERRDFLVGSEPNALRVADFDLDGNQDVIVGSDSNPVLGIPSYSTIVHGNGDGTLRGVEDFRAGPLVTASAGPKLTGIAAADLDLDGDADLITTSGSLAPGDSMVNTLLGHGDGTFAPPQSFGGLNNVGLHAVADFDGDSLPDLLLSTSGATGFFVQLGNGTGTLQAPMIAAIGAKPNGSALVGDVSGDEVLDLIAVTANDLRILLGNGDGTFGAPTITVGKFQLRAVGMIDADDELDLVAELDDHVVFGQFEADGAVNDVVRIPQAVGAERVEALIDLNRDGELDLVVHFDDSTAALLGNGDGSFQSPLVIAGAPPEVISLSAADAIVADLDDDSIPDVLSFDTYFDPDLPFSPSTGPGMLHFHRGNGDGTFQAPVAHRMAKCGRIAVADFDGDGVLDLGVVHASRVAIVLNELGE